MSRLIKDMAATFRALPRCLIVPLVCLFAISIFTPGPALAQSESVYSDQWVDSAGTLYSYGVTDASDMYEHSAYASVSISSPSGRHASNSFSAGEYGYADTETYLDFDENDLGEYILIFGYSAYCPYYGDLGSGNTSVGVGLYASQWSGQLNSSTSTTCYYSKYCLNNTNPSCTPSPAALDLSVGLSCPSYMVEEDFYVVIGGTKDCFGLGYKYGSEEAHECR
jgi:hypothetical protein